MKNISNVFFAALALTLLLSVGLACKSFSASSPADSAPPTTTSNSAIENKDSKDATVSKSDAPKIEKADFTMTSEEYDREFTRKGVTDKDLEKYAGKNIAVTGRVSMLSLEKKGTVQPWVTLYAPGVLSGVSCYFDDDDLEQMKQLKMDKVVTVQGFQDSFLVPKVSPSLEHCAVIKAD